MKKKLTTYLTLVCFLFISSAHAHQKVRVEKVLLGEKQVPAEAYYGVQTARAPENFKIFLTSGPRAGLAEINLPASQPGSSIMPDKVNPVVHEVMNLVAFRVMGNDYTITLAAHSGQLKNLESSYHAGLTLRSP